MPQAIAPAILASVAGAAASTILGKVMSKGDSAPPTPPVAEPTKVMPMADSESTAAARKRAMITQSQRQGRASTILTQNDKNDSDTLGG